MPLSSSPNILLVEDSEDDAFFFRWTLQKSGVRHELTHVADGAAALDFLRSVQARAKTRPDIVFLDLKLPSYSGFEILEWIRQQAWEQPLHVIVLSGSEHATDVTRAQSLGAAGYCVKPISAEQLRDRLNGLSPGVPPDGHGG